VIYFAVFGAGVWYILKLMGKSPASGETGPKRGDRGPIRTAGIAPGLSHNQGDDGRVGVLAEPAE